MLKAARKEVEKNAKSAEARQKPRRKREDEDKKAVSVWMGKMMAISEPSSA